MSARPCHYRNAHAIIIVFDVTQHQTFALLPQLLTEIQALANTAAVWILIGCKIDNNTDRQVPKEEATAFAHDRSIPYIESSSKHDVGIQEAFNTLLSTLVDKIPAEDLPAFQATDDVV